ncbi:hypothetical protein [Desulfolucanica intricata]|uniref:hypothetical protein n=1 Tax=Desulfolucanica intricata TaxID=1285191 RepID=UPI00082E43D8|nr:hypothetical protein [Desulfolucanica intricata]
MAKQRKKVPELTVSGFKYDKELARVPIKVFPALQALIANQLDLMEIAEKHQPDKFIFLEAHKSELAEVEETISKAHSLYFEKKEREKAKRAEKRKTQPLIEDSSSGKTFIKNPEFGDYELAVDTIETEPPSLDELASKISPGLPSSKYESRKPTPRPEEKIDLRRIAVGASIKALQGLLNRELTEKEITAIEKEIDSYL